jgi:hypothetical protein
MYIHLFVKLFRDSFSWSYEEIPGIDPHIFKHEIRTYENANIFWQTLKPINPRKAVDIKAEVEALLEVSFIYLVPLTEWVSNPIPIDKK